MDRGKRKCCSSGLPSERIERKAFPRFHRSIINLTSAEARPVSQATEVTVGLIHKSHTVALLVPLPPSKTRRWLNDANAVGLQQDLRIFDRRCSHEVSDGLCPDSSRLPRSQKSDDVRFPQNHLTPLGCHRYAAFCHSAAESTLTGQQRTSEFYQKCERLIPLLEIDLMCQN